MSENIANGAAAPQQQPQAAAPAAPPVDPTFLKPPASQGDGPRIVPYPVDYVEELRTKAAQLSKLEQQYHADREAAEAKQNELLAQKGQVEEAFTNERSSWQTKLQAEQAKLAELQTRYHGEKINAVLGDALAGRAFAGPDEAAQREAARMLRSILQNDLDVTSGPDGSVVVVDKSTRRPAVDVLPERLSDPKLAFFFAANSRGGSGTDGTRPPAHQQQSGPPSLLEEMVAQRNSVPVLQHAIGLGPRST